MFKTQLLHNNFYAKWQNRELSKHFRRILFWNPSIQCWKRTVNLTRLHCACADSRFQKPSKFSSTFTEGYFERVLNSLCLVKIKIRVLIQSENRNMAGFWRFLRILRDVWNKYPLKKSVLFCAEWLGRIVVFFYEAYIFTLRRPRAVTQSRNAVHAKDKLTSSSFANFRFIDFDFDSFSLQPLCLYSLSLVCLCSISLYRLCAFTYFRFSHFTHFHFCSLCLHFCSLSQMQVLGLLSADYALKLRLLLISSCSFHFWSSFWNCFSS